jgi:hypothetical protein
MAGLEKIDEVLRLLVGQYVWSVRNGVDTFITMEFGETHRVIYEPIQASEDASTLIRKILGRRKISIKGDFSLWVRDSRWSIFTKHAAVNWDSDLAAVREMISNHLDGQKVLSAVRRADETVLEFDLGTTLRLGKSMFPTDMESMLWTIQVWGSSRVGLLNNGAVFVSTSETVDAPTMNS